MSTVISLSNFHPHTISKSWIWNALPLMHDISLPTFHTPPSLSSSSSYSPTQTCYKDIQAESTQTCFTPCPSHAAEPDQGGMKGGRELEGTVWVLKTVPSFYSSTTKLWGDKCQKIAGTYSFQTVKEITTNWGDFQSVSDCIRSLQISENNLFPQGINIVNPSQLRKFYLTGSTTVLCENWLKMKIAMNCDGLPISNSRCNVCLSLGLLWEKKFLMEKV